MPKTTVDEQGHAGCWKYDIHLDTATFELDIAILPESEASAMEHAPEGDLWLGIGPPVGHHRPTRRFVGGWRSNG